jgi:hypothetical protein
MAVRVFSIQAFLTDELESFPTSQHWRSIAVMAILGDQVFVLIQRQLEFDSYSLSVRFLVCVDKPDSGIGPSWPFAFEQTATRPDAASVEKPSFNQLHIPTLTAAEKIGDAQIFNHCQFTELSPIEAHTKAALPL